MNNKKAKIIFFTAIAVFLVSLILLLAYLLPRTVLLPEKNKVVKNPQITVEKGEELPDNPKNFKELKKQNADIYAWISVPGTLVDYPVLQSGDDKVENFYINHGLDNKYLRSGSIYSQRLNSKDFSDPNTILYGHNMKNDSMFGSLHSYRDPEFFKTNNLIYVYTEGHILTYKIYAAYRYDNRHILNSFNFSDEKIREDYFKMTLNPITTMKNIDTETTLTKDSKILTLSTCITNDNYRYLVQGVLINDQLTK